MSEKADEGRIDDLSLVEKTIRQVLSASTIGSRLK
jgi:hypothetical protein